MKFQVHIRGLLHIYDLTYVCYRFFHHESVFLRLSVSIKDKWITKTLHDNKKDDSSPSYSDKIEYDADGNGSNMAYSSKVAVEYKHHKVFVYVSRFYAPAILSHLVSLLVVVMVAVCVPQEKSVEDKIMGHSHRSSSNVGLWIYQIPIRLIIIISFWKISNM